MHSLKSYILASAIASFCFNLNAATVVDVTGITAHDGGNWPDWAGHLTDAVNGSNTSVLDPLTSDTPTPGMTTTDPDVANWTWSGNYQTTWHANSHLDSVTSANGKIGYVILDFGSVVNNLENIYMWASTSGNTDSGRERVRNFNLYYSSGTGIDALPAMPKSKGTNPDYDFSVGDWTQMGTTLDLGTATGAPSLTQSLGGVSAQYLGIEIMSIDGVDTRMAIAQMEVTAVPEPSAFALLAGCFGLTWVMLRRRIR